PDIVVENVPQHVTYYDDHSTSLAFWIHLRNVGRGIGSHAFANVDAVHKQLLKTDSSLNLDAFASFGRGPPWTLVSRPELFIPPGVSISLITADVFFDKRVQEPLRIRVSCGSDSCPTRTFEWMLSARAINDIIGRWKVGQGTEASMAEDAATQIASKNIQLVASTLEA